MQWKENWKQNWKYTYLALATLYRKLLSNAYIVVFCKNTIKHTTEKLVKIKIEQFKILPYEMFFLQGEYWNKSVVISQKKNGSCFQESIWHSWIFLDSFSKNFDTFSFKATKHCCILSWLSLLTLYTKSLYSAPISSRKTWNILFYFRTKAVHNGNYSLHYMFKFLYQYMIVNV